MSSPRTESHRGRAAFALDASLVVLATLNLGAGIWLSLQPARATDFHQVLDWTTVWLRGSDPYAAVDSSADYPPWALVLLAPLTNVAPGARTVLWVGVNLALLAGVIRRLTRATTEPAPVQWRLGLLLAASGCARTLNQFSLLAFALGVGGTFARRRVLAGALIGLSLLKPQIGLVALAAAAWRRQWKTVAIASLVPVALLGLFAAHLRISPLAVLREYASVVASVHDDFPSGQTELWPWVEAWFPVATPHLWFSLGLACVLALPLALGRAARDGRTVVLGLFGAISLLSVRHLSYDLVLLWPSLVAWRQRPFSVAARQPASRLAYLTFWVTAAWLIVDLPAWARVATTFGASPALLAVGAGDRLLPLVSWFSAWKYLSDSGRIER